MIDSNIMYSAFEGETRALAASYDIAVMPDHRFSWRYKRRKRAIIKAYQRSLEKPVDFVKEYNNISLRQRVRLAVLIATAALAATGAGVYVTHIIGGIMAKQQSTHSNAFAIDWENAPETLEKSYRITYDLSEYSKDVWSDNIIQYRENYSKDNKYIDFSYYPKAMYQNIRLNTEGFDLEEKEISGYQALYYITPDGGKCLVWDNGEYIFQLFFNIDYDIAVKIIESIEVLD